MGVDTSPPSYELKVIRSSRGFTSFHELASVNRLADVLNVSLSFVLLTWLSRTFMNSSSEHLFHLADTYGSLSEMPGTYPSKHGLTIWLVLRPSASLFTLASSWNLESFNSLWEGYSRISAGKFTTYLSHSMIAQRRGSFCWTQVLTILVESIQWCAKLISWW